MRHQICLPPPRVRENTHRGGMGVTWGHIGIERVFLLTFMGFSFHAKCH